MSKQRLKIFIAVGIIFAFCIMMLACSPAANTSGSAEDASGDEVVAGGEAAFTWTADADCAICHEKSVNSLASLGCEAAQGNPASTCMNCHTDANAIESGHEGLTLTDTAGDSSRLKKSKVEDSACISCHSSQDDLIAATASYTGLADTAGLVVNPHEVKTVRNKNGAHDEIKCSSCHKMHSDLPIVDNAKSYCVSCHHGGTFECNTCHD